MGNIYWDTAKNQKLKTERNISFEEILVCLENRQILAIIQNPNKKYRNQSIFVVELRHYVYYVPFVKAGEDLFFKTIIPSRKLTKEYLRGGGGENA